MSAREWEPGSLVRVTYGDVDQVGLIRPRKAANGRLEIAYVSGGFDMLEERAQFGFVRPLVVIDPEDRAQVERLTDLHVAASPGYPPYAAMQAALRSLLAPPKPDEPQGKWAVVIADGRCLIRAAWATERPWNVLGTVDFLAWDDIDADDLTIESVGVA